VISIIGPGMRVIGDCQTDGTIRIEGSVEGEVNAGKAVVVGKDGVVSGSVTTQDAVVAGRIVGSLVVESRLEVQATSRIEGEVYARRIQLEEGAILNGTVDMGERPKAKAKPQTKDAGKSAPSAGEHGPEPRPEPRGGAAQTPAAQAAGTPPHPGS
jgi:cytoskeletal protein CcmA (bactofilin family)